MCRNIKTLYNFQPPATDEEIRASALQFVRKLSGFTRPSKTNQAAFDRAVEQVAQVARDLVSGLVTNAPPRNREDEVLKARARTAARVRSAGA
jgi:hypothetical protein